MSEQTKRPSEITPEMKAMQWKPGQSGNPGGVSHVMREVRDLCQKLTPAAVKRLEEIMHQSEDLRAALEAIKIIFVRGIGKEKESEKLEANGAAHDARLPDVDVRTLPDQAIDEIEAVLRKYAQ